MGFFANWRKLFRQSQESALARHSRKAGSLESRQSGSTGGMSTTELLIRLELVVGQNKNLSLMDYATEIAGLSHPLQLIIFSELTELEDLSHEHACLFLVNAATAFTNMEQEQYQRWLSDVKKLLAIGEDERARERIANFVLYTQDADAHVAKLSDITYTLEKLVYSLYNQELPIFESDASNTITTFTNGYQLFLPDTISHYDNYDDNYRLYKILTFQLLGQLSCRSWQSLDSLNEAIEQYGNKYLSLFSVIESLRIDKYIQANFPGIWRDIELLHNKEGINYPYGLFGDKQDLTVRDSLDLAKALIAKDHQLPDLIYQPGFIPGLMNEVRESTGN